MRAAFGIEFYVTALHVRKNRMSNIPKLDEEAFVIPVKNPLQRNVKGVDFVVQPSIHHLFTSYKIPLTLLTILSLQCSCQKRSVSPSVAGERSGTHV
ncbi:hypothetical protein KIN20_034618 [Parelaphostrongylus tenuis]|uniref:Uncharacterized protein n=1 Tax=Parelaphostrongylus tenuis TaxID=148309 RepID=A0AAD5RAH2_PARTN|nr:hypothetical protein KIN20_034618 [Parelaphostrongylus tenuis]